MIARFESWGAWVRLDTMPAVVAIDREGARSLGLDGGKAWSEESRGPSKPLEVHVAVTSRCGAGCESCYLDARPDGVEPPIADVEKTFDALAKAGVFTVAFGGGEPTLRDDLGQLADAARSRNLTPVVTTSGLGLGPKKLAQLERFAQVNVSFDGASEVYESVRGFDGSKAAESAIRELSSRGVRVGVNVVLTRDSFPAIERTLTRAFELGAGEAQLLRYKPAGRAKSLDYLARRLSPAQTAELSPLLRRLSGALPDLRIRIDCALVPFLADVSLEDLTRWGVFGCEAGASLAATKVDGRISPCSFAEPSELNVSALPTRAWGADKTLAAFRDYPSAAPEPCASCEVRAVCRGGCKIVAMHVDGELGPDPECPRVRAHRAQ